MSSTTVSSKIRTVLLGALIIVAVGGAVFWPKLSQAVKEWGRGTFSFTVVSTSTHATAQVITMLTGDVTLNDRTEYPHIMEKPERGKVASFTGHGTYGKKSKGAVTITMGIKEARHGDKLTCSMTKNDQPQGDPKTVQANSGASGQPLLTADCMLLTP